MQPPLIHTTEGISNTVPETKVTQFQHLKVSNFKLIEKSVQNKFMQKSN